MIEIVVNPALTDAQLQVLWVVAWGDGKGREFQSVLARSLAYVGAFDGARLVGFVNVAWDGGVHAFILDTCVDPAYRRQGIAVKLVGAAREAAVAGGAEWLHVDYEPHLAGFYAACGFRPTQAGLMRLV